MTTKVSDYSDLLGHHISALPRLPVNAAVLPQWRAFAPDELARVHFGAPDAGVRGPLIGRVSDIDATHLGEQPVNRAKDKVSAYRNAVLARAAAQHGNVRLYRAATRRAQQFAEPPKF